MTTKSTKYFRYYTYIEPVIKNPFIKTYGYTIFTIVMTAVFIIFAIKPTLETIVVLQKKLADQQEALRKLDKKIEDLGSAQRNYQNIDPTLRAKVQGSIPQKGELANLIRSLENAANQTEASISALQFQPLTLEKNTSSEHKLQEISFTYNIEGTYNTLKQVLQNLYSSTRIITIDKLSFNKVTGAGSLLMSVSGKAYYLK